MRRYINDFRDSDGKQAACFCRLMMSDHSGSAAAILAADWELHTFASAEACLRAVAERNPDLLLVDVSMPGMDGYALCRHLKDDWQTQDIPVIFISAHDNSDTRLLCYERAGNDFIQKPFEPAELLSKLIVAHAAWPRRRRCASRRATPRKRRWRRWSAWGTGRRPAVPEQILCLQHDGRTGGGPARCDCNNTTCRPRCRCAWVASADDQPQRRNVPLEVSVLNHVRESGRIFQFKSRCVFNYGQVTLLVNNMPLDDAERCGRIRDNGALLAKGRMPVCAPLRRKCWQPAGGPHRERVCRACMRRWTGTGQLPAATVSS
jgi:CheY-like chemotaxis protein